MGGRIMASTINADTSNGVIITPDTSGEIELQANGVTKAKVTSSGLTDSSGNAYGLSKTNSMYRNLVINGNMQIAQRGTSATGLTGAGYHTVDRFFNNIAAAGTWTSTQDTDVPSGQGFVNSHKLTCTATASSVVLATMYMMEGQMLQHLKKGTANPESLTLSFWVKSNKTGTYIIELYDVTNARQISKSYTINTANTWEKKILTFAGDTTGVLNNNNGRGIDLYFWFGANSTYAGGTLNTSWASAVNANRAAGVVNLADTIGNYINITGVQLEVGEGSSDFECLPYDVQLQRCQRYYEKSGSNQTVAMASGSRFPAYFAVTKRATPTMVYTFAVGTNNTSIESPTVSGFRLYTTGSVGAPCEFTWTASSEL